MRLAYVCTDRGIPVFGRKGGSVHVQEVVRGLLAHGVAVEIFARRVGGRPPPGLESVPLHRLPAPPSNGTEHHERAALDADDAIASALREAGLFDAYYERHALWTSAAMELARERGVPGLLEVNAPLVEEQARYRSLTLPEETEERVARSFDAASAFVAVSTGVADYLQAHPAVRGSVHVIPNGVDVDRFAGATPSHAAAPAVFTIGFVGTLKPWHGVESLVEAFALLRGEGREVRLLVVGDGPGRPGLEATLSGRGVRDAAEFTGIVDPQDVPGLLASMDAAVAPYPRIERFYFSPLKLYEYMAAGCAVVASDIGQVREAIGHEVEGLLVPPGEVGPLTDALRRLHDSPSLRTHLGRAAQQTVRRHHTWRSVARRIIEIARDATTASEVSTA